MPGFHQSPALSSTSIRSRCCAAVISRGRNADGAASVVIVNETVATQARRRSR